MGMVFLSVGSWTGPLDCFYLFISFSFNQLDYLQYDGIEFTLDWFRMLRSKGFRIRRVIVFSL